MNAIKIPQRYNQVRKWRKVFCVDSAKESCNCIGCTTIKIVYLVYGVKGLEFFTDRIESKTQFSKR